MDKLLARSGVFVLAGFILSVSFFSCRKEGDTVAKVMVVDTSGAPVNDAMVRLYPTPTLDEHSAVIIDDTLFTGADGIATFDYTDMYNLGQAGFAVLDIECRSGDTLYGEGLIKVEAEKTSEATVIVQP